MTATVGTYSPVTPVSGPVPGTVMTPGYARAVGQMAYAWGWLRWPTGAVCANDSSLS